MHTALTGIKQAHSSLFNQRRRKDWRAVILPRLKGQTILIVEREVASFISMLLLAIDETGAETLVARSPRTALECRKRFPLSAAVVNAEHRELAASLGVPIVLYGPGETPMRPGAIVLALERLLKRDGSRP
jgi:hypothetical protein